MLDQGRVDNVLFTDWPAWLGWYLRGSSAIDGQRCDAISIPTKFSILKPVVFNAR
jgi:hypothetical protein